MIPAKTAWHRTMGERWAARATELRARGGPGDDNRAYMLDLVARQCRERVAAATPTPCVDPRISELEKLLAGAAPRPGPFGLIINGGHMMDRVRGQLAARIAELHGQPAPTPAAAPIVTPAPPPEALPFTAGPQLDLFGMAA